MNPITGWGDLDFLEVHSASLLEALRVFGKKADFQSRTLLADLKISHYTGYKSAQAGVPVPHRRRALAKRWGNAGKMLK